ncbi:MAG: helix-turn-helix domain-containing protein [Prevotella ruminicola]|jgi:AraC-like DNA-binding protein|uniref:Helix-turn-helix domain-containing protein n=1 Tax=Xylanibacter ruminicola TaxID=839 RepID=A0A928GHN8_XYLRU|nr:helix-turn-helix domain-containing protein [Xylanibacter ruminicola]
MDSKVLREITPLNENDFMYVADRHKKEFDYPIHIHDVLELNFVANAAGARRVVGDSSEVIDNLDLVLITSPDLEHVWEQYECKSEDIHEVTVQFRLNFDLDTSSFRFSSYKSIYDMLIRAQRGLAFPPEAIMLVYHRLARLSSIEEGFIAVQEFFSILYELSKFDDARELASSSFAKVEVVSESKRILKVKNYIDEHYKDDLSLEQLADLVGMTPTAFSRYFKQRTAKNISEYIVDIRLGHAARLLVDTSDSVSEICWATGFNTLSNFNRLFRKRKGCSPTEFREKYQKTKVIV